MLIFYLPAYKNFPNAKIEGKLKLEEYEFSLYGFIWSYGSGNIGHYTTHIKDGNVWRLYNDSTVSDKSYDAGNSYLVFYLLNKSRT
ncbi:unnamed protein product [Blepharisma stoltei]|uniref:USP domain-containing protein n=1 Tax=Blepharisma stoltei TaxID=1481888 RepID=A0AAU9JD45_9CILI|nr:unnamed protein product [Blepharisma stoltei]CAG9324188.1 unnamed protein product [Blepharisma stoltei]